VRRASILTTFNALPARRGGAFCGGRGDIACLEIGGFSVFVGRAGHWTMLSRSFWSLFFGARVFVPWFLGPRDRARPGIAGRAICPPTPNLQFTGGAPRFISFTNLLSAGTPSPLLPRLAPPRALWGGCPTICAFTNSPLFGHALIFFGEEGQ